MKRLGALLSLLLCLCMLTTLVSCGKAPVGGEETPKEPETQDSPTQPSTEGDAASIRLALPDGISAELSGSLPTDDVAIQITEFQTAQEIAAALLDQEVDLAQLSPQTAASLYRSGSPIQVVAVVSAGNAQTPDSMGLLVGLQDYLAKEGELVASFLSLYDIAVKETQDERATLATGWDMMDLVQQELEAQYAANPDPSHAIPDQGFFYLP